MTWDEYKCRCDQPQVFSRWMLERTASLLDVPELGARLAAAAAGPPLPKPEGHRGGVETDMFELTLDAADRRRIVEILTIRRGEGRQTAEGRKLGGFVEAWDEYANLV